MLDFMNWGLNLFIISIDRKRFELHNTGKRLWAVNNSKNTVWAILFYGVGSLFIFSGLIEFYQTKAPFTIGFIVVFFFIHPIFGIISLRQFLWLVNGKQELIVEGGDLTLRKLGTFFTPVKVYSLTSIRNIRKAVDENKLSSLEFTINRFSIFKKAMLQQVFGEILFDYEYNAIRVFNDLSDNEKDQLLAELLKVQQVYKIETTSSFD